MTSGCCWDLRRKGRYTLCLPWDKNSTNISTLPCSTLTPTIYLVHPQKQQLELSKEKSCWWDCFLHEGANYLEYYVTDPEISVNYKRLMLLPSSGHKTDHAAKQEGRLWPAKCQQGQIKKFQDEQSKKVHGLNWMCNSTSLWNWDSNTWKCTVVQQGNCCTRRTIR